jgi:hypothetical protein
LPFINSVRIVSRKRRSRFHLGHQARASVHQPRHACGMMFHRPRLPAPPWSFDQNRAERPKPSLYFSIDYSRVIMLVIHVKATFPQMIIPQNQIFYYIFFKLSITLFSNSHTIIRRNGNGADRNGRPPRSSWARIGRTKARTLSNA